MNEKPNCPTREEYDSACMAAGLAPFPLHPCMSVVPMPAPGWGEEGYNEYYHLLTNTRQAVSWYKSAMERWERAEHWYHEYRRVIGGGIEV